MGGMQWGAVVAAVFLVLLLTFCHRLNRPPTVPKPVYPPDGATGVPIDATLSWRSSDPDGDPITFTVFLNGEEIAQATETSLKVSLEMGRDYSWSVTARDVYGNESRGGTWIFATVQPTPAHLPPGPVFPAVSRDGVVTIDLEDPKAPNVSILNRESITFAMLNGGDLYTGGCGWFEGGGTDLTLEGCVEDAALIGETIFLAMGKDGLIEVSPSTVMKILDEYVNGVDYEDGILAVTAGPNGLMVSYVSSPSSFTKIYEGWVSKPTVWKGKVYALSSEGILIAFNGEDGWETTIVGSPTWDYSVWNGSVFTLQEDGMYELRRGILVKGRFGAISVRDEYAALIGGSGVDVYFIGEATPIHVLHVDGNFTDLGKVR